jgi:hypothetical protein
MAEYVLHQTPVPVIITLTFDVEGHPDRPGQWKSKRRARFAVCSVVIIGDVTRPVCLTTRALPDVFRCGVFLRHRDHLVQYPLHTFCRVCEEEGVQPPRHRPPRPTTRTDKDIPCALHIHQVSNLAPVPSLLGVGCSLLMMGPSSMREDPQIMDTWSVMEQFVVIGGDDRLWKGEAFFPLMRLMTDDGSVRDDFVGDSRMLGLVTE